MMVVLGFVFGAYLSPFDCLSLCCLLALLWLNVCVGVEVISNTVSDVIMNINIATSVDDVDDGDGSKVDR